MADYLEPLQVGFYLVVLLLIALLSNQFFSAKNVQYPPLIKGWVPWLGCAIDFGKAPLNFIRESWQNHGAVFTLYAAGQRMTFLTDVNDFPLFFNSPQADFQRAVEEAVRNTSGMSKGDFFASHRKIHDLVKGKLSTSNLHKLVPKIGRQLDEYITNGTYVRILKNVLQLQTLSFILRGRAECLHGRRWGRGTSGGGEDSRKIWVGVCGPLLETLVLFQTKICDFLYPISVLTKSLIPYFWPAQELLWFG